MVKRHLNDEEKKLSRRNIEYIKKEIEYGKAMIEYYDLQLNKLLVLNLERKKAEFKQFIKQLNEQIEIGEKTIKITEEQIRNGVEVKEKEDENKSKKSEKASE